jgi:FlaA1/EpsC-like NDP-sugar epimerase
MGEGGEIFILDMGKPVKIVDLARDLIRLSGLRTEEEIEIVFSGVRPGEKLFEELSTGSESADKTKHPKIFIGRIAPHQWAEVYEQSTALLAMVNTADVATIRDALAALVPEYKSTHPDHVNRNGDGAVTEPADVARTSRRSASNEVRHVTTAS